MRVRMRGRDLLHSDSSFRHIPKQIHHNPELIFWLSFTTGAESRRFFFPLPRGFFFLICSVFRPLHLSCHFPSMLHAICSILELEPFILCGYLQHFGAEPSMLHAICSVLALELFILHAICHIWGAETFYLSCYLPHLRAGTFQFACYF